MKNIAVLVSGGGSNLQSIIDSIELNYIKNVRIRIVISSRKDAFALKRANAYNIDSVFLDPYGLSKRDYTLKIIDELNNKDIDLVCLAGFMFILTKDIIDKYPGKIMNIHPALLPKFGGKGMYGMHVHNAVIASKEKLSGATVHFVTEECDRGPIILQKTVKVSRTDTPSDLARKVLEIEHKIYPKAIKTFLKKEKRIKNKARY